MIGAGPNGLVAANLLASAGLDVVVLEATGEPGGAVRTAEVTAPGFRTDLYSAFYPLAAASPVITALGLGDHGLRWAHSPAVLTHVTPDGRTATIHRDVGATAASLDAWAPGDGDAWRAVTEDWLRLKPALLDALFTPMPPVRPGLALLRRLGAADALRFARFALLPVRRYGEEAFRGEGARVLVAGNAQHSDLSPEAAGSAVYGWVLSMLGQDVGFPTPVGGAGSLTDALVARLRAEGGELHCDAPVSRVLVRGGRAVGVDTADGRRVEARHAVLADVPAPALLRDLVGAGHLPRRVVADLDRFQWDDATVKVNWALGSPIPWSAPDARLAATLHLGVDMAGFTDYAADLATGRVPRAPLVLFGQMSTADPTRSPPGTESAWAYWHVPRSAAGDTAALLASVEAVQAMVERHAPGFGSSVLARQVQLPGDLQAGNPSLVAGAVQGGTAGLHQQLVFRPLPGLGRAELPVAGLYLASASAHPGGGVHGAPGANAARAVLTRRGPLGRVRGTALDAALRLVQGR